MMLQAAGRNYSEPVILSTERTHALAVCFSACGCSDGPFPEVFPLPVLASTLVSFLPLLHLFTKRFNLCAPYEFVFPLAISW